MFRHKRLTPNRANLNKSWVFTKNDELVLRYLARYRYLRGTTLHALLGKENRPSTVNYSLRKLFDRRLIDKPKSQALGYNSLNDTDIYEITERGRTKLIEAVPEVTNLVRQVSDAPVKNFNHAMMICDALSSIEIGVNRSDCTFIAEDEILAAIEDEHPLKLPCTLRYTWPNGRSHRKDTHIIPDGVFGIRYKDGRSRLFLLEAEHYNPLMPTNLERASFFKKVLAYKDVKESGAIRQLGKSSFTVLFVFPTKTRARNAEDVAMQVVGKSELYWLNHTPVQEEIWKSPRPNPALFTGAWRRVGFSEVSLSLPN